MSISYITNMYCIVQNGGGGKLWWRLINCKNLVRKTSKFTSLVHYAKFKTTIICFIITCRARELGNPRNT